MELGVRTPGVPRGWAVWAAAAVWLLVAYVLGVLFWDGTLFGVPLRRRYVAGAVLLVFPFLWLVAHMAARRGWLAVRRLKDVATAAVVTLACVLLVDAVHPLILGARGAEADFDADRERDPNWWTGETMPERYHPTDEAFRVHKPNAATTYLTYGDLYYGVMRQSRLLLDSVLQMRTVTYVIDEHGFRDTGRLADAQILALGDSYVFGVNTNQEDVWVERLQVALGVPVHNLGVSGASPLHEVQLLEYVLRGPARPLKVDRVIWMIFSGNDLADEYNVKSSDAGRGGFVRRVAGRALDALSPSAFKRRSLIEALISGRLTLRTRAGAGNVDAHRVVDGVQIGNPLYHSARFGYRLFRDEYIEAAQATERDVVNHPNRRRLDATLMRMAELSREFSFRVTVVLAPSAPRLYARHFDGFPRILEPHFANYVQARALEAGFDVINLIVLMQPYADQELLYWRDDTHWNARGHAVAAALIAERLR